MMVRIIYLSTSTFRNKYGYLVTLHNKSSNAAVTFLLWNYKVYFSIYILRKFCYTKLITDLFIYLIILP